MQDRVRCDEPSRGEEPGMPGQTSSSEVSPLELTDGAPRARSPSTRPRRRPERDDLEERLLALTEEVRAESEEAQRKKREASVLEARMYVADVKPLQSHEPGAIDGTKIRLAPGLDPRQDPTLIGRRTDAATWEFGLPEEEVEEAEPPTMREGSGSLAPPAAVKAVEPAMSRRAKVAVAFVSLVLGTCVGVFMSRASHAPRLIAATFGWRVPAPAVSAATTPSEAAPEAPALDDTDPRVAALRARLEAENPDLFGVPSAQPTQRFFPGPTQRPKSAGGVETRKQGSPPRGGQSSSKVPLSKAEEPRF